MLKVETDNNGMIYITADDCVVRMQRDGHRIYFQMSTADGGIKTNMREETAEAIRDAFTQLVQ
jgi:hypothetical protein